MTDEEAKEMLEKLREHFHTPVRPVDQYCDAFYSWASVTGRMEINDSFRQVELAIRKSCLLDRLVYCGEKLSKTPCPVHKGKWSGCHFGWPGKKWSNGTLVKVEKMLQDWHDQGCRCYLHGCGCTTGWQPDENCGCGVKP
jgi:hypothetical protein